MTGAECRKLRTDAGLTQAELAQRIGLGKSGYITVSRWENGHRRIPEPTARLIRIFWMVP